MATDLAALRKAYEDRRQYLNERLNPSKVLVQTDEGPVYVPSREADPYDLSGLQPGEIMYQYTVNGQGMNPQVRTDSWGGSNETTAYRQAVRDALASGQDLSSLGYGADWTSSNNFLEGIGGVSGLYDKNYQILPANPVGYSGGFKFDPNFGSTYYRELANAAGNALGLTPEQVLKTGSNFALENFYDPSGRKMQMGQDNVGSALIDRLAQTAGVAPDKLEALKSTTLKPLYDASGKVDQGLKNAWAVESNTSGVLKDIGSSFAEMGPIGTILLTAALGPAGAGLSTALAGAVAAAAPSMLQGNWDNALKSGALAGITAGLGSTALGGLGSSVSDALGGGALGEALGGAAQNAVMGGARAALTGGNIKDSVVNGALSGAAKGVMGGIGSAGNPTSYDYDSGLSGGLDSIAGDLGYNYGDYVGGLDSISGDIGSDYLGSTGRAVDLGNFLSSVDGSVASGAMNQTPYSMMNPLTGKEAVDPAAQNAKKLGLSILGGTLGAAGAAMAGGQNTPQSQMSQINSGVGSLSLPTYDFSRGMSTKPITAQYAPQSTASLAPIDYKVMNPTRPAGFAKGGLLSDISMGIGSLSGRMISGRGDGLSDSVNAQVGDTPIRVADGEYIVPAQAVSALGNGSTQAGAKVLDSMVKRVYTAQGGKPKQMKPINHSKVLPR